MPIGVNLNPLLLTPELLPNLIARLTPRQMEIINLLAQGYSNKQTGTILSIGRATVRTHINTARKRIGVDNRTQLIVIYAMWKATN